ncbi:MAG: S66 peptidase family protein [Leadbetterella sp.]
MLISPPFLRPGDKIGIPATSSQVNREDVQRGIDILISWGFEPVLGSNVGTNFYNFAATKEQRKGELQTFIDSPEIKAILCARGGYGLTQYIDEIDFSRFLSNPKWVIGFSDLTALLAKINGLGYQAIHGPMLKTMSFNAVSNAYLLDCLTGNTTSYTWENDKSINGSEEGLAIGGNLCMLSHSVGTSSDLDYTGKILFIEDISEHMYSIDRMLGHLDRARKLEGMAGLVVGDFTDTIGTKSSYGYSLEEIVNSYTSKYKFPVAFGFSFGHEKGQNHPIKMGAQYRLDIHSAKVKLVEINDSIIS